MSKLSLYRKYRQQKFTDLFGQDHIKAILIGGAKSQKIGQAYLFVGSRGTGKTTTARILAKVVNCLTAKDGEPCNQCPNCQLIAADKAVDIIEIDAASNRGIDEIRDLRERVNFPPQILTKKVYIIDEVHMLTNEAFNALLKTLEEPPDHSLFILATTEGHKVPLTIQSRTQRLNFHLGTITELSQNLQQVADLEKIKITPDAINLIALSASGGFRDSLTILEQVASDDHEVTEELVRQKLGLAENQGIIEILEAVFSGQKDIVVARIDSLVNQSANPYHLHRLLIENLRQNLRLTLKEEPSQTAISPEKIIKLLEELINIEQSLKNSLVPFLPLEVALIKVCLGSGLKSPELDGSNQTNQAPASQAVETDAWSQVIEKLKAHNHSISQILKGVKVQGITDNQFEILVKYQFHADRLQETKIRQVIEKVLTEVYNQPLILNCQTETQSLKTSSHQKATEDLISAAEEILG